jgi:hypothetical protein
MEMSGQLHAPAALSQGKSPCYPLDRRLGGPRSQSGHGSEEKNSQPVPGLEPPIILKLFQIKIIFIFHHILMFVHLNSLMAFRILGGTY